MSQVAIGVTIGSPDTAAQVQISASDLAKNVAQAVTDQATTTSALSTLSTAVSTLSTDAGTTNTDAATTLTDMDTFGAAVVAITGDTYSNSTHQFTFGGSTGLTSAQVHTTFALLNTALTALIATKTAAALVVTDAAVVTTDQAAVSTAVSAVSTDLTAAQTVISGMSVLVQTDTSLCDHLSLFNGAINAALNFAAATNVLPA